MKRGMNGVLRVLLLLTVLSGGNRLLQAAELQVRVENLSPTGGLFLTPFWIGFHNGGFDLYDSGSPASLGLERIAEDGTTGVLSGEFAASAAGLAGGQDGVVTAPAGFPGAPVFDTGDVGTTVINVNGMVNRYFSYASMVIPSNDAFLANGNPTMFELFDANGNFNGPLTITLLGSRVLDSGTEDNTEFMAAFFDQTAPNTGVTTIGGVVGTHPGFIGSLGNPGGTPRILGGTTIAPPGFLFDATLADFTQPGVVLGQITISQVPEPSSLLLGGGILVVSAVLVWRRQRSRIAG